MVFLPCKSRSQLWTREQVLLKHVVDINQGTEHTIDRIVVVAFKASEHCRDVHGMLKIQDPRIDSAIDSRIHGVSTKNKLTEPSTETRDVYASSESSEIVEQEKSSQSGWTSVDDRKGWRQRHKYCGIIRIVNRHVSWRNKFNKKTVFHQEWTCSLEEWFEVGIDFCREEGGRARRPLDAPLLESWTAQGSEIHRVVVAHVHVERVARRGRRPFSVAFRAAILWVFVPLQVRRCMRQHPDMFQGGEQRDPSRWTLEAVARRLHPTERIFAFLDDFNVVCQPESSGGRPPHYRPSPSNCVPTLRFRFSTGRHTCGTMMESSWRRSCRQERRSRPQTLWCGEGTLHFRRWKDWKFRHT